MMAMCDEIEMFLLDLKSKIYTWGLIFPDESSANSNALLQLEINPRNRLEIIGELGIKDYSKGPVQNLDLMDSETWIFKKIVKEREVKILITMGTMDMKVICISFQLM